MINETIYEKRPIVSNRIKSPCKDCPNRQVGCSIECAAYKDYKSELAEVKAWLQGTKNLECANREQDKFAQKLRWRKKHYGW